MQKGEFIAFQPETNTESTTSIKKKYAPRSKEGCITCRRRRVKCDETKPECQRCVKGHLGCLYVTTKQSKETPNNPQVAPSSLFTAQNETLDLQFWTEIGATTIGRWHCPIFYEQLLPQFSSLHESSRYALLALSTCVRQWHVPEADHEGLLKRGATYYSLACRELLRSGEGKSSIEATLVASLALFCFDSFTDNMKRRNVHSDASISFLRLLKQGLTYNDVSGWRSDTGKVGAQVVIEAAEAYLNDISYPVANGLDKGNAVPSARKALYIPMWLQLDHRKAITTVSDYNLGADPIEPPSKTWVVVEVAPSSVRACHRQMALWHCWLFTWLINSPITSSELLKARNLCRTWHVWLFAALGPDTIELRAMQNRARILDKPFEMRLLEMTEESEAADTEALLNEILELITSNIRLHGFELLAPDAASSRKASTEELSPREHFRGLAKVVEFVLRKSHNSKTREKACALFSLRNL